MQVDVNALNARQGSHTQSTRPTPARPTRVSLEFYRRLCQDRVTCYRCLKPYDASHQTAEGRPAGCPNSGVSSAEMDAFVLEAQRNPSSVSAVAMTVPTTHGNQRSNHHRVPTSRLLMTPSVLPRQSINFGFQQTPAAIRPGLLSSFPPLPSQSPSLASESTVPAVSQPNPTAGVAALFHEYRSVEQPEDFSHGGNEDEYFSAQPMFSEEGAGRNEQISALAFHGSWDSRGTIILGASRSNLNITSRSSTTTNSPIQQHYTRMYHSLCSTASIALMTMCTVLTTPVDLDRNVDTVLRLGTLYPGTIVISKLDKIDPLDSKLAAEMVSLELTLAAPSGTATNIVPPKQHGLSGVLGIQKTDSFKHSSQRKQRFRISPDVEMWLEDQTVQPIKPVSHLLENLQSIIPYNNLVFEASPSRLSAHNFQESVSRNSQIHEVSTRSLPRFYANSLQGSTLDPFAVNFENMVQDHHRSIIKPRFSKFNPTSKVPEEKKISGTSKSGSKESLPIGGQNEASTVSNSRRAYRTILSNTSNLSTRGRQELWAHDRLKTEISRWFKQMEGTLKKRIKEDELIRIVPTDIIRKALNVAHRRLTTAFLGYLVRDYQMKGKNNEELLSRGWEYLKSYMVQWESVNLEVVLNLQGIQVESYVGAWTPAHLLAYLMSVDGRKPCPPEVLSKFVFGWDKSNAL
ncbi:uncharacterized protein MELLADRAFT_102317 [Melampsora larici-populina 98AG31]|uniref:Uncharacterized protein n=1 Tax=Melampsora larici-populina (strain 98AG31 / pathotype 3-4-7) TaxID=747676 RepID=F4R7W6_MELLP|nr:uncharacterized protein MELLADRAFT_102317 [Melampsora larici-populina 98AG31]EGG11389.1 hypothetical protein MELLADRAFT_102317 [Melampsora larici-populina 98AG31]